MNNFERINISVSGYICLNGREKGKQLRVTHPNFGVDDGIVSVGQRYIYSEACRSYEMLCMDVWEQDDRICLQLQVLRFDPKPYSIPVGEIFDVSINKEGIGFQGMWYLRDGVM